MTADLEAVTRTLAHDTYTHAQDGRTCVLLEDGWFVPLDAGGEGYWCERVHGVSLPDDRLAEAEARLQRVEASLPACYVFPDGAATCLDVADERWTEDARCLPCKIRAALSGGDES